jgi:hypothetical protein
VFAILANGPREGADPATETGSPVSLVVIATSPGGELESRQPASRRPASEIFVAPPYDPLQVPTSLLTGAWVSFILDCELTRRSYLRVRRLASAGRLAFIGLRRPGSKSVAKCLPPRLALGALGVMAEIDGTRAVIVAPGFMNTVALARIKFTVCLTASLILILAIFHPIFRSRPNPRIQAKMTHYPTGRGCCRTAAGGAVVGVGEVLLTRLLDVRSGRTGTRPFPRFLNSLFDILNSSIL